jgi:serine protease Do
MTRFRRALTVLSLSAASVAAGWFGYEHHLNAAFAEEQKQVEATRDQLNKAEDLATVFRSVGKVVEPSVVNINVRKTIKGVHKLPMDPDMLRKFFPRDENGQPQIPDDLQGGGGDEDMEQIGTGSGVIMDVDGSTAYVLTNNHVAGGAEEMLITLSDGREISKAKLVGADPKSDLAVVKFDADRVIPAKWGNSDDLQKGDWIMAFGSPFGYVGSMTHGIISALNRTNVGILGNQGYENFIQVDAPINPGNSGGPLVNLHGEVVGINTAIASRSGGFQGIGFAIPSNQAKQIYSILREKGKVTRGWLGVSISDVAKNLDEAKSFGYTNTNGVLVEQILPKTPATGKLQPGDIVTKLNGKPVDNVQQLRNTVAMTAPGSDVTMSVFRDGKERDVTIKIAEQPENALASLGGRGSKGGNGDANVDAAAAESLGLKLQTLNSELAEKFGLADIKSGAVITAVAPRSTAARAGLRPGDVITKINRSAVNNAKDASDVLAKEDLKKGVRMYVTSAEGSRFVFLRSTGQE